VPETVAIQYGDLFEFLEDWRANLSQLQFTAKTTQPPKIGDWVHLEVHIPVLEQTRTIVGRVMAPMGGMAGLQIDPAQGEFNEIAEFYALLGRLVEQLLVSGRFQIAGQWAEGAQPVAAPPAQTGQPAQPAAAAVAPPIATGEPSHTGDVTVKGLTDLLMELYRTKANGLLEVTTSLGVRRGWFKQGGLVAWEAEPLLEDECLGVLLTRAGRIDPEQLKETLHMMNDRGIKQGEALIEMGVFTFPQVVMALMKQVEIKTRNLFAEAEGVFAFFPMDRITRSFVTPPMKSPGFLFAYYKKRIAATKQAELEARQVDLMDRYVKLAPMNWDDARLSKQERSFIEILTTKSYRFRQVYTVSNMGRNATMLVLLTLLDLGLLEFEDSEDSDQVAARWRKQLNRKLLDHGDQNPFEILEVHWTSRDDTVKAGYDRLRAQYEKYGRGAQLPGDLEETRAAILANLDAAYASVATQAARVETRKKYFEPQQHEFSADLLFKQGEMLMVRNQWRVVIENFERAIELQPGVGKYKQFLSIAKSKQATGQSGDDL
jgi:hypothetical protein